MRGQAKHRGNTARSSQRPARSGVRSLTVSATTEAPAPRLVTSLYELLGHAQQFTLDDDEAVTLVTQIINARRARIGRSRLVIENGQPAHAGQPVMWLEAEAR